MTGTPRLWKSQTQVNTSDAPVRPGSTSFQASGQIAALQDGGYVVVWTDASGAYNPVGFAAVGQRYDFAGNKVGGEVKISQFDPGFQFPTAVTVLPNGNIAVAVVDADQLLGSDADIYVRIFDSALNLVRTDTIDIAANISTFDPSLTAFGDGSYVVSYTRASSGVGDDIAARIVSATGAVGAEFNIDNQADNQIFAELATLSNGNFVAAYQDQFAGSLTDNDILFRIFTPAGTPVPAGPVPAVPGAFDHGLETQPDVAALRDGGFVVVWTDPDGPAPNDIRASILSNVGLAVASDILVNTNTAGEQNHAGVVALADGGFLVSWEDGNAGLVRAQRFDALGDKIGVEFTVKSGVAGLESPEAALLTDGRIAFALDDISAGDIDVVTSIWTTGWGPVATGDFNGDGTKDILWQDALGATSEWLMASGGGVAAFPPTPSAAGWSVVASGDFNGDGTTDILWKNGASGATSEWLMSNGGMGGNPSTPSAAGWGFVASGDFNDDGTTDVLWQNSAGLTSEWLMSANGGVGSNPATPSAAGWALAGSGDFNGDGTDDLMWKNVSSGATSEWLMSNGSLASNPGTPGAAGWNLVATGDFNHDGTDDLMWQNASTGATSEWLMSASGGVGSNPATPSAAGWNLVAHGDFNGDGTADLLWENATTGATSEWLMTGGALASNPATPSAAGWELASSGDFNGDHIIDLMWQNLLTGATSEWLMSAGGGVGSFASTPMT